MVDVMCLFISTTVRLGSHLSAWPTVVCWSHGLFTRVGWTLVMSALELLRAFIYSSRLDSRLSVQPFIVQACTFYLGCGGWSPAMSGIGALLRWDSEKEKGKYRQVQY